ATSKGLYYYHPESGIQEVISNSPVLDIHIGTQNIIWAGTDMKGVYKIVPFNERFKNYSLENFRNLQHPVNGAVRTFFEDENQSLWVGTKGAGIFNFTQHKKTNELALTDWYGTEHGLLSNSVYEITDGNRNEFWIGTDGNGINYYDKQAKRIYSLDFPANLSLSSVYAILPDSNNVLWIGTSGYGMFKLEIDYSTQPYSVINFNQFVFIEGESSLSNNIVYAIIKDGNSHLWIGTRGGGVNRFDKHTREFEVFKLSENNPQFYGCDDVLCLYDDMKGNLWAGTSMGLTKLTWKKGEKPDIVYFNEQNGLPNNTIHGILMDAKDNLWVSTNNGLAKLIPENNTYRIVSYFTNDGLHDNEFSDGAYYASPLLPEFYFGGISGFSQFNPLEIIQSEYMPELWLDAFYVDNIQSDLTDFLIKKDHKETLQLSHKNNSFGFSFVPIDFLASNKCEIAYKLEGFHNEWVNIGTSNAVMFTNLPKGDYLLKIKSSNANKIWGDTVFSLPVTITPPWWDSNIAYLFYTILLLFILYIIREIILYRLKVVNDLKIKELEKQKIEEIHQGKLSFFTNIAHEFSNSLTLIYGPCDKLIIENRNNTITRKYLQVIKSNAERMQHLIEQLVDFRKAETGHLRLKIETVDVPELIKYAIDNFLEILEQKKIEYTITSVPENIHWKSDRDSLEKIVFNLLSNAAKYTPEEHAVSIRITASETLLTIQFSNSGIGIKPESVDQLFDKFEVLNQFEKQLCFGNYSRHGIGLALCKSIVQVMHGDISVDSDGVTYTSFVVELPELEAVEENTSCPENGWVPLPSKNGEHEELIHAKEITAENGSHGGTEYILVVEDDQEIRTMIKDLFRSNYTIQEASNGKEALDISAKQRPVLVISDIIMPVMNGVELVKRMKASEFTRHIPIILLSSKNS
ncbi:MAG: ATP-binding protein, partial [Bacteroidales bacterium]|nr:ATP-binding protein [Bacteroidales bacterium]